MTWGAQGRPELLESRISRGPSWARGAREDCARPSSGTLEERAHGRRRRGSLRGSKRVMGARAPNRISMAPVLAPPIGKRSHVWIRHPSDFLSPWQRSRGSLWGTKACEGRTRIGAQPHTKPPTGSVVGAPYGAGKRGRGVPNRRGTAYGRTHWQRRWGSLRGRKAWEGWAKSTRKRIRTPPLAA